MCKYNKRTHTHTTYVYTRIIVPGDKARPLYNTYVSINTRTHVNTVAICKGICCERHFFSYSATYVCVWEWKNIFRDTPCESSTSLLAQSRHRGSIRRIRSDAVRSGLSKNIDWKEIPGHWNGQVYELIRCTLTPTPHPRLNDHWFVCPPWIQIKYTTDPNKCVWKTGRRFSTKSYDWWLENIKGIQYCMCSWIRLQKSHPASINVFSRRTRFTIKNTTPRDMCVCVEIRSLRKKRRDYFDFLHLSNCREANIRLIYVS